MTNWQKNKLKSLSMFGETIKRTNLGNATWNFLPMVWFFFITMVTILQLKLVKRQLFEKGNLEPFLTKGTWDTCIYSVGMFKNWGKWSILCKIFQVIFHWKQSPYSYFSFQMFANTKDEFALVLFGTEGMCMLQFKFLIS